MLRAPAEQTKGGRAEGLARADPGARTPIGGSGILGISYLCYFFLYPTTGLLDKPQLGNLIIADHYCYFNLEKICFINNVL